MWEFFWFISGVLIYRILEKILTIDKKIDFVTDIKLMAFQLIGRSFEDIIFAHALKYKILHSDPSMDKEKIKAIELHDESWLEEWREGTVQKLNSAVHPFYRSAIQVKNWKELMDILNTYYKEGRQEIKNDDRS